MGIPIFRNFRDVKRDYLMVLQNNLQKKRYALSGNALAINGILFYFPIRF